MATTSEQLPESKVRGVPLEAPVRRAMESSFGHNFSDVRVHHDEHAAKVAGAHGALAFATGREIFFGANQFQPQSLTGRALLAHELAHTIQQKGATPAVGEDRALEQSADRAAVLAAVGLPVRIAPAPSAPGVQFRKVSSGGFGVTLEQFTDYFHVKDTAINMLGGSSTFQKIAATLDAHYVPNDNPATRAWEQKAGNSLVMDDNGTITRGPSSVVGKHQLQILQGDGRFLPSSSPDNHTNSDQIWIDSSTDARFIQQIAHEATHAARRISGAAPAPKDLADAVRLGVIDETAARQSEAQVLSEMPAATRKAADTVGSFKRPEIERDLSPGFNLTYLELFFFGFQMNQAIVTEKLTPPEMSQMQARAVKGDPIVLRPPGDVSDPHSIFTSSVYGDLLVQRETCRREWIEFDKKTSQSDPDFTKKKEKLLQDHAQRFFDKKVAYQKLP